MSSGFKLEPREGYLYVQLDAGLRDDAGKHLCVWMAICEACRERGLRRALAEGENVPVA